jgi:hypothetical protein
VCETLFKPVEPARKKIEKGPDTPPDGGGRWMAGIYSVWLSKSLTASLVGELMVGEESQNGEGPPCHSLGLALQLSKPRPVEGLTLEQQCISEKRHGFPEGTGATGSQRYKLKSDLRQF